jgi:hypothetical protein
VPVGTQPCPPPHPRKQCTQALDRGGRGGTRLTRGSNTGRCKDKTGTNPPARVALVQHRAVEGHTHNARSLRVACSHSQTHNGTRHAFSWGRCYVQAALGHAEDCPVHSCCAVGAMPLPPSQEPEPLPTAPASCTHPLHSLPSNAHARPPAPPSQCSKCPPAASTRTHIPRRSTHRSSA